MKIELRLGKILREKLVESLGPRFDMLAWSHEDMLGIDPKLACHKLVISWNARLVK